MTLFLMRGECLKVDVSRAATECFMLLRRQEVAPTDIMGLFSIIYDRINEDLDDVVKVEINYVGNVIHR